jgi:hypothetical protein
MSTTSTLTAVKARKSNTKKKISRFVKRSDEKKNTDTRPVILVLHEHYDIQVVKRLSRHPDVKPSNRRKLREIVKHADKEGSLKVEYCYANGRSSGRLYAKNKVSLQSMSRRLRNTLAQNNHFDLDIQNCNPTLLLQLCMNNGWAAPHLEEYVKNRSRILKHISEDLVCAYDDGKELFLALINGGSYETWAAQYCVKSYPTHFIVEFVMEMKKLRKHIWDSHPQYHADANAKVKEKEKDGKKSARPDATCMHYVIADIENNCLQSIREYLSSIGREMSTLIFDGGLVRGDLLDINGIEACETFCKEKTGFRIKLVIKPMSESLPTNPFCTLLDDFVKKDYVLHFPFNEQYTSDANIPKSRVLLLISPPGTGKTHYVAEETKAIILSDENAAHKMPIIIPSARIAITKQHMTYFAPLGFSHYETGNYADKLITTIDSLIAARQPTGYMPGVTILDEIETTLAHLFGATLNRKRLPTFQKLLQITTRAQHVFALDGDIGDLTITFFRIMFDHITAHEATTPQKSVIVAQNSFLPSKKRIVFADKYQWFNQLRALLIDDDSKIFVGCDSCTAAQVIAERIKQWWEQNQPDKENVLLLYTSKDGDKEELEDASKAWASAKIVICSPTIGPATDYNNEKAPFTAIMGYYRWDGRTIGVLQVGQQLKRPRDTAFRPSTNQNWDYYIYVHTTKSSTDETFEKFPKQVADIELKLRQLDLSMQSALKPEEIVALSPTGATTVRKEPIAELYLQFIRYRNLSRGQLKDTLQYMLELNGHSCKHECPACNADFDCAAELAYHKQEIHSDIPKTFVDEILNDKSMKNTENEIWQQELDDFNDLIYDHNEDEDINRQAKKNYLRQRDERAREWLHIPPGVEIPEDSTLYPILFDEKSQNAYQQFESFCRTDDRVGKHTNEDRSVHITQNVNTVLNILHLIETKILKCKRFECLFWPQEHVRTLVGNKISELPPQLNELLAAIQHFEMGEGMMKITTMHNAYRLVCEYYKRSLKSGRDADGSTDLIVSCRLKVKTDKIPSRKLKKAKHPQKTCQYCNTPKNPEEFYSSTGARQCKTCRNTTFRHYQLSESAPDIIAQYIEIIASQPAYEPENYRITEPAFKKMTAGRSRVYNTVWPEPHQTLDNLVDKVPVALFTEMKSE